MKFKIAIQNKGRLCGPSLEFLRSVGLKFDVQNGIILKCKNADVEILFVRNSDIPTYVQQAVADFGIVGSNVIYEGQYQLPILQNLGFGKCSLVIAAPEGNENLDGERIATSYPNSLKLYLKKNGINASIIKIGGSVEAAPSLGLADAVCDITQSGNTLQENNLKILDKILDSEAVLIGESDSKWNTLINLL